MVCQVTDYGIDYFWDFWDGENPYDAYDGSEKGREI